MLKYSNIYMKHEKMNAYLVLRFESSDVQPDIISSSKSKEEQLWQSEQVVILISIETGRDKLLFLVATEAVAEFLKCSTNKREFLELDKGDSAKRNKQIVNTSNKYFYS